MQILNNKPLLRVSNNFLSILLNEYEFKNFFIQSSFEPVLSKN